MREFKLSRNLLDYKLTCDGHVIHEQRFNDEVAAIIYFRAFISSWVCSTLIVEFEQLPTEL